MTNLIHDVESYADLNRTDEYERLIDEYESLRATTESFRLQTLPNDPVALRESMEQHGVTHSDIIRLNQLQDLIDRECELGASAERNIELMQNG